MDHEIAHHCEYEVVEYRYRFLLYNTTTDEYIDNCGDTWVNLNQIPIGRLMFNKEQTRAWIPTTVELYRTRLDD